MLRMRLLIVRRFGTIFLRNDPTVISLNCYESMLYVCWFFVLVHCITQILYFYNLHIHQKQQNLYEGFKLKSSVFLPPGIACHTLFIMCCCSSKCYVLVQCSENFRKLFYTGFCVLYSSLLSLHYTDNAEDYHCMESVHQRNELIVLVWVSVSTFVTQQLIFLICVAEILKQSLL